MPTMKASAMNQPDIQTIISLVEDIKPLLAGHAPVVQGAALAELLAIWIGGHHASASTVDMRNKLLEAHILTVRALVALAEQ
jgi:adenine deaminase